MHHLQMFCINPLRTALFLECLCLKMHAQFLRQYINDCLQFELQHIDSAVLCSVKYLHLSVILEYKLYNSSLYTIRYLLFVVWLLLLTHCRWRGLLLPLIKRNTHTHDRTLLDDGPALQRRCWWKITALIACFRVNF
jgi:hypothetical protein